ncbi:MAG TPA: PCP reductase family protein, partial [Vicinamibacterales bacterium]
AGDAAEARTNSGEAKLIARDDKKNPLISTFDYSAEAAQRILRVPAGFMRNKTQERVEGIARERALTAIDLALVEEGIEIGKQIMAQVIAAAGKGAPVPASGHGPSHEHKVAEAQSKNIADAQNRAQVVPAVGSGYLNEVSSLSVPQKPGAPDGDNREH